MLLSCDGIWADLNLHGRTLIHSLDCNRLWHCAIYRAELSLLQEVSEKSTMELHFSLRVHLLRLVRRRRFLQLLRTSCGTVCCGDHHVHGVWIDGTGMLYERKRCWLFSWLRMCVLFRSHSSYHIFDHLAFILADDFGGRYLCGPFLNLHNFRHTDDHANL